MNYLNLTKESKVELKNTEKKYLIFLIRPQGLDTGEQAPHG